MNILQVAPDYYPQVGGIERHVQSISEELVALGHRVTVVTMSAGHGVPLVEQVNGVSILRLKAIGYGRTYRVPLGLGRYVVERGDAFDLVHVHGYHALMLPIVAVARPRRLVMTPHSNDSPHSALARALHWPYSPIARWSLYRADAVICVSVAEQERLAARLRIPIGRLVVVGNGVSRHWSQGSDTRKDAHLLLAVGRLEKYKHVEHAISVLAHLPRDYRLVVVGEGRERARLESRARREGVSDRVTLVGAVDDAELTRWYSRGSVLLTMSAAEAFGLTVLEALCANCSVVCSDIPAFRELANRFPERVTAVAADDIEGAVAAVRQAAGPAAGPDLSEFTWRSVTTRLLRIYEHLAAGRHAPGPSPDQSQPPRDERAESKSAL